MRLRPQDKHVLHIKDVHPVNLDDLLAQAGLGSTDAQEYGREDDRDGAQGDVEKEQPSPGSPVGEGPANRWSDCTDKPMLRQRSVELMSLRRTKRVPIP